MPVISWVICKKIKLERICILVIKNKIDLILIIMKCMYLSAYIFR